MSAKRLRIIFMGTPEFSVPVLHAIHEDGFDIAAVITAPDKPAGRGMQLQQSAVKQYAVEHQLHVLQPANLKNAEFIASLKELQANINVIVAFRMLPESVWNLPPLGSVNLHASLLPDYRGAAPINWAIIRGEKITGLSTFFLQHEIDTGKIIHQEKIIIEEDDVAGTLYEKMKLQGAKLMVKTLRAIEANDYPSIDQAAPDPLKTAPKLSKENSQINWNDSAKNILNHIRGLSPYPSAWTMLNGRFFKIFKASVFTENTTGKNPGLIESDNKTYLHVYATDGYLALEDLQMEGKKRMSIAELLRGYKIV